MRIFTRFFLIAFFTFSATTVYNCYGQLCAYPPWSGGSGSTLTPGCDSYNSYSVGSGTYSYFTAYNGASYTVSTCGTGFDTQVSIYDENPGWTYRAGNDDNGPDCSGSAGSVTWTATYTGNHLAIVNRYYCQGHDFTGQSAILKIRQNSPTISNPATPVCAGNVQTLTTNQPGGTWSATGGSINQSGVYTATTTGSFTITYSIGVCSVSKNITVLSSANNPGAITLSSNAVCVGTTVTVNNSASATTGSPASSGPTYYYYYNINGAGYVNYSTTSSPTSTLPSIVTNTPGNHLIARNSEFGCAGQANNTNTVNIPLTVYANSVAPSGIIVDNSTICVGGTANLTQSGGTLGTGASYKWYSGSCGGTFVGTGGSIAVSPGATTNYFVRVEGAIPCLTTSCANTTVNVNPTPTVAQPGNQSICAGSPSSAVSFSGSGTSYNWTNNNTAIGLAGSGTGDVPSFSGTNTGTSPITGTITVTPINTVSGVSCPGPAKTFSITVNPIPAVNQPGNQTVCASTNTSLVTFSGVATSYNWTNDNTSIGLAASGSGSSIPAFTATNSGTVPITGTITVTPIYSGCPGAQKSFSITVNPTPSLNQPSSQTICNNNPTSSISFSGTGTSYTWTNTAPSIGLATSGTGDIASFNATNTGTTPVTATITATPVYSNNSVNCNGSVKTFTITVNPTPTVNQPTSQTLCHGSSTSLVSFSGTATSYTWTNSNTNIGLAASGTGNIPAFTATNPGATPISGTITVTPVYTNNSVSCNGPTKAFSYTVNPLPVVGEESHVNLSCLNSNDGIITIAIPSTLAPYQYSINGGSTFLPSNGRIFTGLPAGTYNTFIVQDANGCRNTNTISITLTQPTQLNINLDSQTDASCNGVFDGTIVVSASGGTPGYQYSLNGGPYQPGATFTNLAAGSYTVTVKDAQNCTNTVSATLNNSYVVTATISSPVNVSCPGLQNGGYTINGTGGVTPYSYANNTLLFGSGNVFSGLPVGTYTGFVRDSRGCLASDQVTITANPGPTAIITGTSAFCAGGSTTLSAANSTPGAGSITGYQWALNGSNINGATSSFYNVTTAGNYTVTVTNSNNCSSSSATTTVNVNPLPSITVNPFTSSICAGASISLTASGASTYTWSPGSGLSATTGTTVIANPGGTTTYTVTGTDVNGCVSSTNKTVTVNNLPNVTITPSPTTICSGSTVQLTASGANSYTWSPATGLLSTSGATVTAGPTNNTTYTVTGTDLNGCSGTRNVNVTVTQNPVVSISTNPNPATICLGQSITLTSNFGSGNTWSTGATTQSITVTPTQSGTITYNLFSQQSGCTGSASKAVTVNIVPFALINPQPTASICNGSSVTLTASTDNGTSYLWSPGGATSPSISASAAGPYTVTITNSFNCSTTSAPTTVVINSPPSVSITPSPGSASVCAGNTVTLTATAGLSSYTWSNGLVGQSITVNQSGTYTVTVTDANGCTNTASQAVTINPLPTVSFSGLAADYCVSNGSGITLTGSPSGGTFTSTGGGLSGNTFTPSVAGIGTYTITYTYTDANSCTSSSSNTVTVHALPTPSVTAQSATTFCAGNSVVLTTQAATSYLWSPGGATTQLINVTQTGNYSVTATNAFGCSATSAPLSVTVNPLPTPVITPNNPTTFCEGGSVTLSTGSASSYSWLPGLQSTQSIVATTSGNYRVSVTDANGCQGTSAVTTVMVNPNPVPTISGSTTFCTGDNTTLTASAASFYAWTPNGETTQSILVSVTGTYSVNVTDANGCQGSVSVTVSETPVTPVITALGSTTFCQGDSVTLFSSSSVGNLWSTQETTQFITVTTSGTVTLNVSQGSCQGTDNITITVNPLPIVSFSGLAPNYCSDAGSATLSGSPSGGTFSGPGISGNSFSPSAAGNGVHTITYSYTDGNGCSDTAMHTVTVNDLPAVTFSGLASQYCTNNPVATLFGNPAGGTFSGTGITGNTFDPAVGAGVYTITYTFSDGNNCISSTSQTVTVNAVPSVAFTGLDSDYCIDEPAVTLSGSPVGGSFSGNGVIGSQFFPSVPGAGTHTVTYTLSNANGCSSSVSQQVTIHGTPAVSFSGFNVAHAYCIDAAPVTLTGSPAGGTFSGTGIIANTFNPATAGAGTFTITYTYADGFGCGNTTTQNVTVNPLPTAIATPLGSTTLCAGGSVIIYSSSGTGNVWSPNGQTTQFIAASQTGNYAVTVTDGNGCSATSAPVSVTVNPLPTPVITAGGPTTFCQGGNVTLSLTVPYSQYLWSNGATTSSITVSAPGSYSVTVTNSNGCTNTSAAQTVTVNPLPVATITPSGTVGICSGSSVTLTAGGGVSFLWDPNGETTSSITVASAGSYFTTVTDANGCTSVSPGTTVVVNNNPVPTVSALGSTTFCQGGSVTLVASSGTSYLWSPNGETNQVISATTSGNYSVTITDGNGCVGTSSPAVTITVNPLPTVSYSGLAAAYCVDANPVLLSVSPAGGFFTGPITGNTFNPSLAGVGTHVITYHYTNGNGCANSYSQTVIVNDLPVVSFTGLGLEYCVDAPAVTLTGSPVGGTFSGAGISGLQFNPATAGAGTHVITYTYTDGNTCVNSESQTVIVHPLPVVTFIGLDAEYCIDEAASTLVPTPAGGTFTGTGMSGNVFDPAIAGAGTWTITYTYTDANTCTNSISHSVTVHPLPVVTFNALANQYCITETSVALSGSPSGGTFTGTGVTGSVFNPSVAGVGSYTLTYTYTDANGCVNSATQTAVVVPLPVVTFTGLNSGYCVNASPAPLTGNPVGGTFSGIGVSGNNFVPSQAGVGTHTVIYTYTDQFGCTNSTSQTVIVTPLPVISFTGLGADYCLDETPATLIGNPSNGTFSGPGISGNTFTPSVAGPGTHTITFSYTNGNGCTGTLTQNVVVYSLPVVSITPVTQQFCVTETSVLLSASPSGGTFSGVGVSGSVFNPSAAGVGTHPVIYYYTDLNGCTNTDTTDIVVLPLPVVTFTGLAAQYCVNASSVTLTGNPSGGTFSGNGITGNVFDPAAAPLGISAITYTYTNGSGCTNSISRNVTVIPLPTVNFSGLANAYCIDAASVTLTGNPPNGTFSGTGVFGNTFSPSVAGAGTHTVSYSYTDINGCTNSSSQSVIVNDLPTVVITNTTLQYCVSETSVSLTANLAGGVFSGNGVSGDFFNPSVAGVGTHPVIYEYSDGSGCENSDTIDMVVVPLPVVSFSGLAVQYCVDANAVTLTGNPAGGVFSGSTGLNGDVFDPSAATIGVNDITYTYSDVNGCTNSVTISTQVYSLPSVQLSGLNEEYCIDANDVTLTGLPAGGGYFGPGLISTGVFSPLSAGVGTHTITYVYQNNVGCIGSAELVTEVHPLPVVSFTGLATIYCLEADSVPLTGTPVGGYFTGPAMGDTIFYPQYAGVGTHTITYNYLDSNGCFNSYSQAVTVYQLAQPQVTANGPIAFCEGDDVILTAQSAFVSYAWNNGATTTSITVDTETDSYITVMDVNGCRATSDTIHTTVNPLPVVDLGPDIAVCPGTPVTLDAGAGFADYLWFPGAETTQTISVTVGGDYRASVTDVNGCFNYDEVTLTVFQTQVPVITASGSPSICDGQTLVLNAGPNFQSYDWSNSANTQLTTVSQTGNYTVTTVDLNGCTGTSAPFNVTVIPLPVVTILSSGPPEICQGNTITLSMPSGYSSYLWSTGASASSIQVNQQGDYYGSATNSSGCSNVTPTIHVTVYAQPQPVIVPQGPVILCYGETIVLDAGNEGYASYNWFRNLSPTNNHSQYAPIGTSGSYTVSVIDTNGCGQGISSPAVSVTVLPDLVPIITLSVSHDTLFSSPAVTYQWYFNGMAVSGANQQFFVPWASGNFWVEVTDDHNCNGASAGIEFSFTSIEDVDNVFSSLNLFPNPGKGRFTLLAQFNAVTSANIIISDMLGNTIMPAINMKGVSSFRQDISLEEFANGVYFVRIITDGNQKVIRYIKE